MNIDNTSIIAFFLFFAVFAGIYYFGYTTGNYTESLSWKRRAVKSSCATYDKLSGKFVWIK